MNRSNSSKDMLKDLLSMPKHASQLLDKGKDYNNLLRHLINHDYNHNDDLKCPTLKELSQALEISYSKLRKQIELIYSDLLFNTEDLRSYNSFWYFRKDEAILKGEISIFDSIGCSDFELKERLDLNPYC